MRKTTFVLCLAALASLVMGVKEYYPQSNVVLTSVELPLTGWIDCVNLLPLDATGADAEPDFAAVQGSTVIAYDIVGGSVDSNDICQAFTVPPDYSSGGAIVARVANAAATAGNEGTFSCTVSNDGAAVPADNAATIADGTTIQTVTSTPVITYAAGESVGVQCNQGNASADDLVNIFSIEWQYTASQ